MRASPEPMLLVPPHPETSAVKRSHRPDSLLIPSETQQDPGASRHKGPSASLTSHLLRKVLVSQPLPESKEQGQFSSVQSLSRV